MCWMPRRSLYSCCRCRCRCPRCVAGRPTPLMPAACLVSHVRDMERTAIPAETACEIKATHPEPERLNSRGHIDRYSEPAARVLPDASGYDDPVPILLIRRFFPDSLDTAGRHLHVTRENERWKDAGQVGRTRSLRRRSKRVAAAGLRCRILLLSCSFDTS